MSSSIAVAQDNFQRSQVLCSVERRFVACLLCVRACLIFDPAKLTAGSRRSDFVADASGQLTEQDDFRQMNVVPFDHLLPYIQFMELDHNVGIKNQ